MANWRDEYFAALVVRDRRDQANTALFDACMHPSPSPLIPGRAFYHLVMPINLTFLCEQIPV